MENDKEIDDQIKKITDPIFEKALKEANLPQETTNNTMSVGVKNKNPTLTFYWRPNNYRLKVPFSWDNLKLLTNITPYKESRQGSVVTTTQGDRLKISNYGTKLTCKINDIRLMIDKKSITATYSLKTAVSPTKVEKAIYKIECNNINDIHLRIDERVALIEEICVNAIKEFINRYQGRAYFDKKGWIRHEDSIHKEDWIPDEVIIYDTHFKKVYPTETEMKSPVFVKNYYSNLLIKEIAPEIEQALSDTNSQIENLIKVTSNLVESQKIISEGNEKTLLSLQEQIRSHLALIQEWRKEVIERQKPFFVRWWHYFKKR